MKTEINKKYGIVALLFTVCSAISLISAVAYLITSADGALYNVFALVWLVTIASGCVLAVFSHGPRWVSFVYLSCVILYGLLHIVSSYLLMIAMGAMSAGGMAYILLRGALWALRCFRRGLPGPSGRNGGASLRRPVHRHQSPVSADEGDQRDVPERLLRRISRHTLCGTEPWSPASSRQYPAFVVPFEEAEEYLMYTRKGGMPQPLPAEAGNGCAVFSAFGAEKRAEKIHPSTAPMASQVLSGRQLTKKLIPLPDNVPRFPV